MEESSSPLGGGMKKKIVLYGGGAIVGFFVLKTVFSKGSSGANLASPALDPKAIQGDIASQVQMAVGSLGEKIGKQQELALVSYQKQSTDYQSGMDHNISELANMIGGIQTNTTHQLDLITANTTANIGKLESGQGSLLSKINDLMAKMATPIFMPQPVPVAPVVMGGGGGGGSYTVTPGIANDGGNKTTYNYSDGTSKTSYSDTNYSSGSNSSAGQYKETVNGTTYHSNAPTVYNGGSSKSPAYYNNGKAVYL